MIPKKIHYCWLSEDEYPPLIQSCIESWQKHLKDYEFVRWSTENFDINQNLWVKQAFENKKYAFVADYVRLYSVYYHGGIYLDSDVEVLKAFDEEMLNSQSFMGLECCGDLEPAILGAEKGTLWLADALQYYRDRQFVKNDESFDTLPMPKILEKLLFARESSSLVKKKRASIFSFGLKVYPPEYFSPKRWDNKKNVSQTKNTYCIHHFNASWIDNKCVKSNWRISIRVFFIKWFGYGNYRGIISIYRELKSK